MEIEWDQTSLGWPGVACSNILMPFMEGDENSTPCCAPFYLKWMESYVCIRKVTYIGFYINSTIIRLIDRALGSLVIIENGLRCIGRRSWQAFSGMHCYKFADFYARHNVKTTVLKTQWDLICIEKHVPQLDSCQRSNSSSWQSELFRKEWAEIKPVADIWWCQRHLNKSLFRSGKITHGSWSIIFAKAKKRFSLASRKIKYILSYVELQSLLSPYFYKWWHAIEKVIKYLLNICLEYSLSSNFHINETVIQLVTCHD